MRNLLIALLLGVSLGACLQDKADREFIGDNFEKFDSSDVTIRHNKNGTYWITGCGNWSKRLEEVYHESPGATDGGWFMKRDPKTGIRRYYSFDGLFNRESADKE